ncbi:MAG: heme-binding domain-containing protein [Chitinophagaceae bacterium]
MDNRQSRGEKAKPSFQPKPKRRWFRIVMLSLLIIFMVIQFFQPDKNNNDVTIANNISSVVDLPDSVNKLLHVACYDCHSNNTEYPWYSNIQPVGWWLGSHIKDGKLRLNFNEFGTYATKKQLKKLKAIKETQQDKSMPLDSYTWIHKDARLTDAERQLIINWADSSAKTVSLLPVKE